MSRYRVRVHGWFDIDTLPGDADPDNAPQQLEGVTTNDFLDITNAYQHLNINVHELHPVRDDVARPVARKAGKGGWHK